MTGRSFKRVVLGYSGGLGTSVSIPWLAEEFGAEVVAVTLDLGQGNELEDVRDRALAIGAVRAHVLDARDEFARDFVLPSLRAGALAWGGDPQSSALAAPLLAKQFLAMARFEGAEAVAHGAVAGSLTARRLEVAMHALAPDIDMIAPLAHLGLTPNGVIDRARSLGMPVPARSASPVRADVNLWGRVVTGGLPDDPWVEPPATTFVLTRSIDEAPATPAWVDLDFDAGVPVRINGVGMSVVELIQSLETIAGAHGVGRTDVVAMGDAGTASRTVAEAPAARALHAAYAALLGLTTPPDYRRHLSALSATYADLVAGGRWFTPTREAIDAFVARALPAVGGAVRLRFLKGSCEVVGRRVKG